MSDPKPWQWTNRMERRTREADNMNRLKNSVQPLLRAGDPVSLARAQQMTQAPQKAEALQSYRASLAQQVNQNVLARRGIAQPEQKKPKGLLGKVKDVAGDVGGTAIDVLGAAQKYVGEPAFGVASGLTRSEAFTDPETGQRYRKSASFKDVGQSLAAAVKDPVKAYKEGGQATREYAADPGKNIVHKAALSAVTDPLSYAGPGVAAKAVKAAGLSGKTGRVAYELLDSGGGGVVLGGSLGGHVAADRAQKAGLGQTGTTIAALAGGLAGGVAGGAVAARGVRQSLKDVDTGLAKVQGREKSVLGFGITDETPNLERYVDALDRHNIPWQFDESGAVKVTDIDAAEQALRSLESSAGDGITPRTVGGVAGGEDGPLYVERFGKTVRAKSTGQPGHLEQGRWTFAQDASHDAMDEYERLREVLAMGDVDPAKEAARSQPWKGGEYIGERPLDATVRDGWEKNPTLDTNRRLGRDDANRLIAEYTTPEYTPARTARALSAESAYWEETFRKRRPTAREKAMLARLDEAIDEINTKGHEAGTLFDPQADLAAKTALGQQAAEVSGQLTDELNWKGEFDRLVEANQAGSQIANIQSLEIDPTELPFNLPEIRHGLTRMDKALNVLKRTIGIGVEEDPIATPAMRTRRRMRPIIESQAAITGAKAQSLVDDVFTRGPKGIIDTLPGSPTIQDVAAKLPNYAPLLTPEQLQVMENLKQMVAPYKAILDEAGVVIEGSRTDVIDGGFYLPRKVDFTDAPQKVSSGKYGGAGGKAGFEKEAVFDTMTQGIAAGFEYQDIGDALQKYGSEAGRRAMDRYTADYFKSLRTAEGDAIGSTFADRISPELKTKYQEKVKELASIRRRLATAERRAGMLAETSDELDTALLAFAEPELPDLKGLSKETVKQRRLAQRLRETPSRTVMVDAKGNVKLQENALRADVIEKVVTAFEDQMPDSLDYADAVDAAITSTARRIQNLETRGYKWGQEANNLRSRLGRTEKSLADLAPRYKKAVKMAQRGERNFGQVGFSELNGRRFPLEIANAANKWLAAERPPMGRGAGTVQTVEALNSLMRGLRATADVSFMGIQGLFGAVRDPIGYGKALQVAYKSMADPNALGAYLRAFDEDALRRGGLSSADWAKVGLHIGGMDTEFAITAKGLTKAGGKLTTGSIPGTANMKLGGKGTGGLNPLRASNRMFGYFGDTMRAELADTMLEAAKKSGRTIDDNVLREIANSANLATGWSPNTFGGELGQLGQFAPRFFQSQLEMIANLTKSGVQGHEARRMMGSLMGTAVILTAAANEFSPDGLPPEKYLSPFRDPKNPLKGSNPNFLRFRLNGTDYSILGPWDSLLRGAIETTMGIADQVPGVEAQGSANYFLRTKASPVLGLAWDLFSGENFIGEDSRTPEYMMRSFLPFSINDLGADTLTPEGLQRTAVASMGVKATPLSPSEDLDTVALAQFGEDFWSLEASQQQEVKEEHPDLWQRYVERASSERQRYEIVKSEMTDQQRALDQQLLSGQMRREDYLKESSARRTELANRAKEIYGAKKNQAPRNPREAYFAVIDAATDPESGVVDWDAVDSWQEAQTPEDQAYIERNSGLGGTELSQMQRKLSREYYSLPRYRGYDSDEAREIDQMYTEVKNRARGDSRAQLLSALRKVQTEMGVDTRTASGVRRRILDLLKEDTARKRWKAQHPEAALFLGAGTLTPADRAAIEGKL